MQAELVVLRVVHVLGGIIWVGVGVFMAFFLGPAMASLGPTAGQVMGALQKRKFMVVLPLVAILTMLSGLRLMQLTSNGFSAQYFQSPMGRTFAIGGLAAIVAFVFGLSFNMPMSKRMATLQQSMASDPASKDAIQAEILKLTKRLTMSGFIVVTLLLLAAVAMATARYM